MGKHSGLCFSAVLRFTLPLRTFPTVRRYAHSWAAWVCFAGWILQRCGGCSKIDAKRWLFRGRGATLRGGHGICLPAWTKPRNKVRYFAPALILVFALAGCISPEERAAFEARAQARVDSLAREAQARRELFRAQARADSLAREAQARAAQAKIQELREAQARAAQAERRRAQAKIQELVAQAYEAEARVYGDASSQRARDARRDYKYALAMAADAESNAFGARLLARDTTAERWRAWNRVAEAWERVVEARAQARVDSLARQAEARRELFRAQLRADSLAFFFKWGMISRKCGQISPRRVKNAPKMPENGRKWGKWGKCSTSDNCKHTIVPNPPAKADPST